MKLIAKLKRLFNPLYSLVYRTKDGTIAMYTIEKPRHSNEFGNVRECLRTAGFRSYCHNRGAVRSFRYDGIISLNKA